MEFEVMIKMLVDCREYHIPDMRHLYILSQAYRNSGKQFWNPMVIRIVLKSVKAASQIVVFLNNSIHEHI